METAMHYKTILVHVDADAAAPDRIRLAARLARQAGAHLVGTAPTGVSRFLDPGGAGPAIEARCRMLRDAAGAALQAFDRIAGEEGVASRETRLADDDVDAALALQARYADIVIVSQPDAATVAPPFPADLAARLALGGGRPVLVVPRHGTCNAIGGAALVAWDGSREATRAVTGALPLLRAAAQVTVVDFGGAESPAGIVEDPCAALGAWLDRHGVAARCGHRPLAPDVGEALLAEAAGVGAGLLVMGAYGHPRLREIVLGGVTETILAAMTLPVLLAH
jgi:nucleotide-binding universal stress UspA family protein